MHAGGLVHSTEARISDVVVGINDTDLHDTGMYDTADVTEFCQMLSHVRLQGEDLVLNLNGFLQADEFGGQELGTAEAVKDFVTKFGFPRDNFTLLERSTMNGKQMNSIFALGKEKFPGDTTW